MTWDLELRTAKREREIIGEDNKCGTTKITGLVALL